MGDGVDARRAAVARARSLTELLAAHGDVEAFLETPYGVAYIPHREAVHGWDEERVASELESLTSDMEASEEHP